jgi:hypothetical protein
MLNEIEEFKAYTTFPDYTIKNSKDNGYLGRFTYDILKDHYALNRVFVILARGYMWETDEPDIVRARRALCAWCSLPEEKQPKQPKPGQDRVSFPELHAEFPELIEEDGAGWFYNHVHNIIEAVLDNTEKNTKTMAENALLLMKGFDEAWCDKLMQYQASPYSKKTKGAWNCRFDDAVAEAKRLGRLQNKDFDLPAETQKMLEDATPKGVPKYVLPELAKYYIANKQEDSDKVVLPVSNFSAYFGHTSFDRKWLKILPEDIIIREEYAGVCRIRMVL